MERARNPGATQTDIARRLGLDRTTVSKVLTGARGAFVGERTRGRIFAMARRLGYDLSRIRHTHRRAGDRRPVRIPALLQIVLWDGTCYAAGHAVICNLSPEGALLVNLQVEPQALPLKPFSLRVEFALPSGSAERAAAGRRVVWRGGAEEGPVRAAVPAGLSLTGMPRGGRGLRVAAEIVRIQSRQFVELAVRFLDLSDGARRQIVRYVRGASHPTRLRLAAAGAGS